MLTILCVLISIYANFTGAAWEDKIVPVAIITVGLAAWKCRKTFV